MTHARIDWSVPDQRCKAAPLIEKHVHPDDIAAIIDRLAAGATKNWCAGRVTALEGVTCSVLTVVRHMDGKCRCDGDDVPLHGVSDG